MPAHSSVPQATLVTGARSGQPPDCIGCREPIEVKDDYWTCWSGLAIERHVLAAAHGSRRDPSKDDDDDSCALALRQYWQSLLEAHGAALFRLDHDAGGPRFCAGSIPLHAGSPLEILDAKGGWLAGRFEYLTSRWTAHLWVPIGGWGEPQAALVLVDDTVVRIPDR